MRELHAELRRKAHLVVAPGVKLVKGQLTIDGSIKGLTAEHDVLYRRAREMGLTPSLDSSKKRLHILSQRIAGGHAFILTLSRTRPNSPHYQKFLVSQYSTRIPLSAEERHQIARLLEPAEAA